MLINPWFHERCEGGTLVSWFSLWPNSWENRKLSLYYVNSLESSGCPGVPSIQLPVPRIPVPSEVTALCCSAWVWEQSSAALVVLETQEKGNSDRFHLWWHGQHVMEKNTWHSFLGASELCGLLYSRMKTPSFSSPRNPTERAFLQLQRENGGGLFNAWVTDCSRVYINHLRIWDVNEITDLLYDFRDI